MKKYNQLKANIILDFYLDEICKFRNYKKSDVLKKSRKREYADVRAIATYLARRRFSKIGLREIANFFNLKCHATVLCSVTKIENLKNQDWDIKRTLEHCEKLDFVDAILLRNEFFKCSENRFSKLVEGKTIQLEVLSKELLRCDITGSYYFIFDDIDIFDVIIIAKNINSNPLGTLINSLKN